MPHSDYLQNTQGSVRNVSDDPFAVRGNRETTAGEIMFTYDPTPATWMWSWDSDLREDAALAASLGLSLRRHHTTADAALFVSAEEQVYAFPGATPARDLWEAKLRLVNRVGASTRMVSHIWLGTAEPNGDDPRLLHRLGLDTRITGPRVVVAGHLKFNDFGPYDYHRDFNLTFPMQVMADVSTTLGTPRWFDLPQTRLGVRGDVPDAGHELQPLPAGGRAGAGSERAVPGPLSAGAGMGDPDLPAPGDLGVRTRVRSRADDTKKAWSR